jgi:hypothetical protein
VTMVVQTTVDAPTTTVTAMDASLTVALAVTNALVATAIVDF